MTTRLIYLTLEQDGVFSGLPDLFSTIDYGSLPMMSSRSRRVIGHYRPSSGLEVVFYYKHRGHYVCRKVNDKLPSRLSRKRWNVVTWMGYVLCFEYPLNPRVGTLG